MLEASVLLADIGLCVYDILNRFDLFFECLRDTLNIHEVYVVYLDYFVKGCGRLISWYRTTPPDLHFEGRSWKDK